MILLPLKEKAATVGERAGGVAFVSCSEGFGGVFEDRDAVSCAGFEDGVHIGRLAEEVYDDEGLGKPVATGAIAEGSGEQVRIEVPGLVVAIEEDGLGAEVANGVGAGGEGESGAEDLVAGSDAEEAETEVDGSGAAGEGDGGEADAVLEVSLEGGDVGADGREPVGGEGLADVGLFVTAHMRDGEEDRGHGRFFATRRRKLSRALPLRCSARALP